MGHNGPIEDIIMDIKELEFMQPTPPSGIKIYYDATKNLASWKDYRDICYYHILGQDTKHI